MAAGAKNAGTVTPVKESHGSGSKSKEVVKYSENSNPNVSYSSPVAKPSKSPLTKSAKSHKSASKNPNPFFESPRNKIRERKFVVAKKKWKKENEASTLTCKCKENPGKKCLCVAYENLRASQEEFFKSRSEEADKSDYGNLSNIAETELEEEIERKLRIQDHQIDDGYKGKEEEEKEGGEGDCSETNGFGSGQSGTLIIKRRREKLLEEARRSVPESGRVMHLVKAFERLQSLPKDSEDEKGEGVEENKKPVKWALPGLQPPKESESEDPSSVLPPELLLTSKSLGLDRHVSVSSSWDSSHGSVSNRTSNGGRRSQRSSTESTGSVGLRRFKKKQLRVTSQKPFKLRTEQRGKLKEEEFMKKLQEMIIDEERQRIPIAQGLPWTTDEPECLIKPPVKESTIPVDLKLHTDLRSVERAEFDHQVAEKMSLIEQYKQERERLRKLAEEEETRRLRKELVPKAQPMPYFDRPFIPKRSTKQPTIPKEPKFHIPEHKKIKCLSWNDVSTFTYSH